MDPHQSSDPLAGVPESFPTGVGSDPLDVQVLFGQLHTELRQLAGAIFAEQDGPHLLQPTALVNEVWLKLAGKITSVENRPHFFALSARAMRQVLADYARHSQRKKRGGNAVRLTFSESRFAAKLDSVDLLAFHEALDRLAALNARHAQVAEFRLLGSLSIEEIAELLGINERTVKRDWQAARLWLQSELIHG